MARGDFLRNLRMASNLLGHRVQTNVSGLDPHWLEDQLVRAGLWLTPSAMGGFDEREFPELPTELRAELKENVERFIHVAKQVPPRAPATDEQLQVAGAALARVLKILEAYLPSDLEMRQVEEILNKVEQDSSDAIVGYDYEMTTNWTGDPAVLIRIFVNDEAAEQPDPAGRTMQVERRIREALAAAGSTRWPYVRFRTRSEVPVSWAVPL